MSSLSFPLLVVSDDVVPLVMAAPLRLIGSWWDEEASVDNDKQHWVGITKALFLISL